MKKTPDIITRNTPPGFMSIRAWREREGITRTRANELIQTCQIKYQRIGNTRYIVIPQSETVQIKYQRIGNTRYIVIPQSETVKAHA